MKTFLFFVMLLLTTNTTVKALPFNNNYQIINLTVSATGDTNRQIPRDKSINPENTTRTRSVILDPVYASLYNKVIGLNFTQDFSIVTITITNKTSGETVYSETDSTSAGLSINLSGENNGNYLIEIKADDIILEGEFYL